MTHLERNLFDLGTPNTDNVGFKRNLVLHGLKGSGKSTLCKHVCNLMSSEKYKTIYHYVNCQNFMSKTPDTIHDQLKLVYQECVWHGENNPSLVVLENIDLLIENKANVTDPSSMLYYSQIVECLKELLNLVWESRNSRTVTLITTSTVFNELPSLFHCLDEHGFFTEFIRIKPHSIKVC
jgi:Cdc6-like AAA superfamily ATPase